MLAHHERVHRDIKRVKSYGTFAVLNGINFSVDAHEVFCLVGARTCQNGMTILMATHEMAFAREVSTRICILSKGVLVEQGTPDQIFDNPREFETRNFVRSQISSVAW
ncbi:hypothetical protein BRY73_17955 [Ochrobactrum sp. P6BS-III]|uniref:hypothetical protein n=1 Tax=unclassified Ochrobactrum TaxID=239106 RepID=UPI0009932B7F|nr:ABC-type polar amino acid transport system ATPase subunit [Ochrobactrum sp. P6BSIII]OOL15666.1 hypothetical protein BRY73_17955 [Ochrobactrum sp. P6BS-III]